MLTYFWHTVFPQFRITQASERQNGKSSIRRPRSFYHLQLRIQHDLHQTKHYAHAFCACLVSYFQCKNTSSMTGDNYGRPMEYGRPLYFCPVVSSILLSLFIFSNTGRKKSPKIAIGAPSYKFVGYISSQVRHVSTIGKKTC